MGEYPFACVSIGDTKINPFDSQESEAEIGENSCVVRKFGAFSSGPIFKCDGLPRVQCSLPCSPMPDAAHGQQELSSSMEVQGCVGKYAGRSVSEEALQTILMEHAKWLQHHHDSGGKPADLCGAELSGI